MADHPTEKTPASPAALSALARSGVPARVRSFCFLERDGERWSVFLVTFPGPDLQWRGYFSFRAPHLDPEVGEIRTADLFVEATETEVDARARGLGRPLVLSLLESALHAYERRRGASADVRRWFRDLLARHSAELVPVVRGPSAAGAEPSLAHLRSVYDSYRLDQVAHLISLIQPGDFRALVERLLDGREIDFQARDRLQLAMIVVQELERLLPLPPFEVWADDYLAHTEEYQRYAFALHRGPELP
ncbi:MAG: hypothetical protein HY561_02680 [Gemmatimonadetes bacterium]|nr:hypothetical protein [Gemmatimonadota bacterium]